MTAMTELKAQARKAAFQRRKLARNSEADAQATAQLLKVLMPLKGAPLAGYMPIRTEVDPIPAMAALSSFGPVGVPVIQGEGQALKFREWSPGCEMKDGPFGAKVPAKGVWVTPQVLIVPLVAFTPQAMRLGYGGGFYDRTLEGLRAIGSVTAIGYAYSAQMADQLPLEATDQPLDMIVTEQGVIIP
ncbi:5-formyltetrahydrofolate cyclo-ligase [uncultured Litoreibacter sp.]|uniref:5-formyltetrahydrofolate cyclo-ligase n=1 Tax=uncultured Litoreibacter sp. TaxID=1392394 RepID=UPI00260DF886|nr:5-formyltetrahydrofolate cyclo-ligase [uncultured Litoreibacter sp.]